MPKNSQYGRLRRLAMQAVMWGILGATLALAAYVSHRRTGPLEVTLAEPVSFGELTVRLPRGWERQQPPQSRPRALVVKERDEEGRQRRELWITQERQTAARKGPTYYLETVFLSRAPASRPEPFSFLDTRGAVIAWRGIPRSFLEDLDEEALEKFPDPGLYACAVRPDGLTVSIQVRGAGAYGPTNQRLIRMVADNLKLSDTRAARPAESEQE
jgi:hypothetical protein